MWLLLTSDADCDGGHLVHPLRLLNVLPAQELLDWVGNTLRQISERVERLRPRLLLKEPVGQLQQLRLLLLLILGRIKLISERGTEWRRRLLNRERRRHGSPHLSCGTPPMPAICNSRTQTISTATTRMITRAALCSGSGM